MGLHSSNKPAEESITGQPCVDRSCVFETTRWSVVLAAGNEPTQESTAALEYLCRVYWYPLYAHIRRRGYSEADAKDLAQGFFAHLLERQALQRVSPERGKFRSFLLAALNYYIRDVRGRELAQKRGGDCVTISFDAYVGEERYALEPVNGQSPDRLFEQRWALALLDQVLEQLRQEFSTAGKAGQFTRLSGCLLENESWGGYTAAARDLDHSEEAVRKIVERMRRRYREIFREEVAKTVADPAAVDQELRYICELMADRHPTA